MFLSAAPCWQSLDGQNLSEPVQSLAPASVPELKESLSRMGSDLKEGFISSLRSAWQTLNDFARAHTSSALQAELAMVANQIEEEEKHVQEGQSARFLWFFLLPQRPTSLTFSVAAEKIPESPEPPKEEDPQVKIGMLNGGNRIDYVLQEKPIESFNEYLFALQSHLCYWYVPPEETRGVLNVT